MLIKTVDGWKPVGNFTKGGVPITMNHVPDDHTGWWQNAYPKSKEYDALFDRADSRANPG